ncbi:MAG: oligosaccharide flippase family protein [Polyangiaceae bacterium]|nr:oligosaccharide flippase family protein [Polyangiaceae bacterium]
MSSTPAPQRSRGARAFILDTAVVFAAQVLTKLRGLITMPLIIRGLGTDAFGTWSQILAFTVLVTAIAGLSLHHSLIRFIAANRERAGAAYGTLLLASLVSSAVLCALFGLSAPLSVVESAIGEPNRRMLWLGLGIVVTTTIRNLNLNLYRATDQIKFRSVVDFAGAMFELVAILVVLAMGYGLTEVLLVLVIAGALIALVTTLHGVHVAGGVSLDREMLTSALRYGVPLVPAGLAMWVLDRSDRFVISHFADQSQVGIYSAHKAIGSLIMFVQGPIQMALTPKVMQLWDADRRGAGQYVEYSFRVYGMLAAPFIAITPLVSTALFRIIANEEVARDSAFSILLIAVGTSFWGLAVIETCALYAAGRTRAVGLLTAASATLNVALSVVLVRSMGTMGAALAMAIAYAITWAAYARSSQGLWRISRSGSKLARSAVATAPAALVVWWMKPATLLGIAAAGAIALAVYVALLLILGGVTPDERARIVRWARTRLLRRASQQPAAR